MYEWLEKLDEKECSHFYTNPFKAEHSVNTEPEPISTTTNITNLRQNSKNLNETSLSSPISSSVKESVNPLFNRKFKIDPFHNPKMQQTNGRLVRNLNANVFSQTKYIETIDKQALAVIKDYKSYLHLNNNFLSINNLNTPRQSVTTKPIELEDVLFKRQIIKDKLKKTISTNEMTLARMKLDLFLF